MLAIRSRHILLLATLVVLPACSSNPKPQALPPQTMAPTPPETEEPLTNMGESQESLGGDEATPTNTAFEIIEEPATTPGSAAPTAESDPLTVVLDPGTDDGEQPQSLFEASQAEKDRREEVGDSQIVLTNKNLKDYSKGQLTFIEDEGPEEGATSGGDGQASVDEDLEATEEELGEDYWRDLVLGIRLEWRESLDRIQELESDIARLRREFYAEDDPFYRDSQIKPAWDQALVELEETRRNAEDSQRGLEDVMEEGNRAGALPGWLREGIELEPTEEELEERTERGDSRTHEPSEPVIVDDDGDGGR